MDGDGGSVWKLGGLSMVELGKRVWAGIGHDVIAAAMQSVPW